MEASLNLLYKVMSPFNCSFTTTYPLLTQTSKLLPDLPPEIWLEIFQFATYVHQHTTIVPMDPFTSKRVSNNVMAINVPSLSTRTKLSLVLVCRSWRQMTIQLLYEYVVIRSPARATALLDVLRSSQVSALDDRGNSHQARNAGYGQWTRHIEVYTHARGTNELQFLQTLFHIFRASPNLRMLSGTWNHVLPLEFLDVVSKLYGPTLEGLYWNEVCLLDNLSVATPQFLASFQLLRILDLRNFTGSAVPDQSAERLLRPSLPKVQDLIISTYPQSLTIATALSLPALRNLSVKTSTTLPGEPPLDLLTTFLKMHGSALVSVDIPSPSPDSEPEPDTSILRRNLPHINPDIFLQPGLCPNLISLTFPVTSPPLSAHFHRSLRRIGLRGVKAESLYPDKKTSARGHLTSFTPSRYPSLELIKTVGFLVDAETDLLIKDIFIWWVERFEKQGIDFLDGEGVLWAYDSPESEYAGAIAVADPSSPIKAAENSENRHGKPLQILEDGGLNGKRSERP